MDVKSWILRHFPLVELLPPLSFSFLKFLTAMFQGKFHRVFDSDGLMPQTAVEFGHVSFLGMWSILFRGFVLGPRASADASKLQDCPSI